jgi:hypothetical protein
LEPHARDSADQPLLAMLDDTQRVLRTFLRMLLIVVGIAVFIGGAWMLRHMDESSKSQGVPLYVGVIWLLILGRVISSYKKAKDGRSDHDP